MAVYPLFISTLLPEPDEMSEPASSSSSSSCFWLTWKNVNTYRVTRAGSDGVVGGTGSVVGGGSGSVGSSVGGCVGSSEGSVDGSDEGSSVGASEGAVVTSERRCTP